MLRKRGLSPVVANVLIILLVIAAVAIVWAVVRPAIEDTGEQIGTGTDCITLDFEILSCDSTGNVVVRRNAGGPVDLVNFRLSGDLGAAHSSTTGLGEVATSSLAANTFSGQNPAAGENLTIVALHSNGQVCNPTSDPVECS